jgi:DNA-binding SARP family transcriptional activator
LRVWTLGRFAVQQGARRIDERAWHQRRAGELFRLLLVAPDYSLGREQVLEALWPDRERVLPRPSCIRPLRPATRSGTRTAR